MSSPAQKGQFDPSNVFYRPPNRIPRVDFESKWLDADRLELTVYENDGRGHATRAQIHVLTENEAKSLSDLLNAELYLHRMELLDESGLAQRAGL